MILRNMTPSFLPDIRPYLSQSWPSLPQKVQANPLHISFVGMVVPQINLAVRAASGLRRLLPSRTDPAVCTLLGRIKRRTFGMVER